MKAFLLLIISVFFVSGLIAQDTLNQEVIENAVANPNSQIETQGGVGGLISQLADNLKDEAFTNMFRDSKSQFSQTVSTTTDAGGLASGLQKLQEGIRPDAMDAEWGARKSEWQSNVQSVTGMDDVATLLRDLATHIAPSYFKSNWNSVRPVWESAVSALAR